MKYKITKDTTQMPSEYGDKPETIDSAFSKVFLKMKGSSSSTTTAYIPIEEVKAVLKSNFQEFSDIDAILDTFPSEDNESEQDSWSSMKYTKDERQHTINTLEDLKLYKMGDNILSGVEADLKKIKMTLDKLNLSEFIDSDNFVQLSKFEKMACLVDKNNNLLLPKATFDFLYENINDMNIIKIFALISIPYWIVL